MEKNNAINKQLQLDNIINYHKVDYNNHILKNTISTLDLDPPQSFTSLHFFQILTYFLHSADDDRVDTKKHDRNNR